MAIAGIIAMEPKCIVLDEPTAMLDPRGRTEVMETIQRLNREKGITIVLITHYMDEAVQAGPGGGDGRGEFLQEARPGRSFPMWSFKAPRFGRAPGHRTQLPAGGRGSRIAGHASGRRGAWACSGGICGEAR